MIQNREENLEFSAITLTQTASDIPDALTSASEEHLANAKEKLEIERLQSELRHLNGAVSLSRWFAIRIFFLVFFL